MRSAWRGRGLPAPGEEDCSPGSPPGWSGAAQGGVGWGLGRLGDAGMSPTDFTRGLRLRTGSGERATSGRELCFRNIVVTVWSLIKMPPCPAPGFVIEGNGHGVLGIGPRPQGRSSEGVAHR